MLRERLVSSFLVPSQSDKAASLVVAWTYWKVYGERRNEAKPVQCQGRTRIMNIEQS